MNVIVNNKPRYVKKFSYQSFTYLMFAFFEDLCDVTLHRYSVCSEDLFWFVMHSSFKCVIWEIRYILE